MGIVNSLIIVAAFIAGTFPGPKEDGQRGSLRGVAIAYSLAMVLNFIPYGPGRSRDTPVKLGGASAR